MGLTGSNMSNREKSLEWFFALNIDEKRELKQKYFPRKFIQYSEHWGYSYTFGEIEEMYNLKHKK